MGSEMCIRDRHRLISPIRKPTVYGNVEGLIVRLRWGVDDFDSISINGYRVGFSDIASLKYIFMVAVTMHASMHMHTPAIIVGANSLPLRLAVRKRARRSRGYHESEAGTLEKPYPTIYSYLYHCA